MRVVAALFCACIAVPSEAATFYYVGAPYKYSNYDAPETPVVTTGVIEIDESKLPAGQGLANLRFDYSGDVPDYVTRVEFGNSARRLASSALSATFRFDSAGRVDSWEWEPFDIGFDTSGTGGRGYDSYYSPLRLPGVSDTDSHYVAGRIFLKQRGYREGTAEFERILSEHTWIDGHQTKGGPGAWYSDLLDATTAMERAIRLSIQNPPTNIYKLPTCPAPSKPSI